MVAGEVTEDVVLGDEAEELFSIDHREAADPVLRHHLGRLFDTRFRADHDRGGRHHLADLDAVQERAVCIRAVAGQAGQRRTQQIALGDDAHELAAVRDRHVPHMTERHDILHSRKPIAFADRDYRLGHDVADSGATHFEQSTPWHAHAGNKIGDAADGDADLPHDETNGSTDEEQPALSDLARRALALGLSGFFFTESTIRKALGDTLPKDWSDFAIDQSERTRKEFLERLTSEIGQSLERIDVATVLAELMRGRTLDISARIRFVDGESDDPSDHTIRVRMQGDDGDE